MRPLTEVCHPVHHAHFHVWVQIKTDIKGQRLNQIIQNARKVLA
jgi:hypothetical protein